MRARKTDHQWATICSPLKKTTAVSNDKASANVLMTPRTTHFLPVPAFSGAAQERDIGARSDWRSMWRIDTTPTTLPIFDTNYGVQNANTAICKVKITGILG